jgi:hypothetical protein
MGFGEGRVRLIVASLAVMSRENSITAGGDYWDATDSCRTIDWVACHEVPIYLRFELFETEMPILTASEACANFYRLIDEAARTHQPITISGRP